VPDATEAKGKEEGSSYLKRKVDRETLRFSVQTAIFCQFTRQPLDVRQAVAVTVRSPAGGTRTYTTTAAHWDARKDTVLAGMPAAYTLEVLDGRELFGRSRAREEPRTRTTQGPSVQHPPRGPRPGGPVPLA
jgi:hypothetical protein